MGRASKSKGQGRAVGVVLRIFFKNRGPNQDQEAEAAAKNKGDCPKEDDYAHHVLKVSSI